MSPVSASPLPDPLPRRGEGATVWFTGLPCSGKTTLALALTAELRKQGKAVVVLDGDDVRRSLSKDLGFDLASRAENVRRCGAVAELITRSGVFAVAALISPIAAARDEVKAFHAAQGQRFFEIYLSAPLSVCEARDVKGLYARARAGLARDVTGVDSPFEPPTAPELVIPPEQPIATSVSLLLSLLSP
jgi:adenylyl-sulfate kinase